MHADAPAAILLVAASFVAIAPVTLTLLPMMPPALCCLRCPLLLKTVCCALCEPTAFLLMLRRCWRYADDARTMRKARGLRRSCS